MLSKMSGSSKTPAAHRRQQCAPLALRELQPRGVDISLGPLDRFARRRFCRRRRKCYRGTVLRAPTGTADALSVLARTPVRQHLLREDHAIGIHVVLVVVE